LAHLQIFIIAPRLIAPCQRPVTRPCRVRGLQPAW